MAQPRGLGAGVQAAGGVWTDRTSTYNTGRGHDRPKESRRQRLEEFVAQNPKDTFSRYGLALEMPERGDKAGAEAQFRTLIEDHADYVPGFQMYAQMLAQEDRREEAKSILTAGIAAATRVGNAHARSEMEGLLAELEAG